MAPSSRFTVSLKPNVVYLLLTYAHFERSRRPCRPRHTRASRTRVSARGWRAGFDDGMEPLSHGAIRFRQLGDLRQPRFAYRFPSLRWWLTVCSRPPDQRGSPARSRAHRPLPGARPPPRHRTGLEVGVAIRDQVFRVGRPVEQDVLGDRS